MKRTRALLFVFCTVLALTASAQDTLRKFLSNTVYLHTAYFHDEGMHECFGIGAGFEKMLDKKETIAANIPFVIGLPGSNNQLVFLQVADAHKFYSSFSAAPGFKFYTGKKTSKVRYALGVSVFFEAGRENTYAGVQPGTDNPVKNYSVFGYMLTNSLRASISRHFDLGLIFGTGMAAQHHKGTGYSFNWGNQYGPDFLAWMMLSGGYRF